MLIWGDVERHRHDPDDKHHHRQDQQDASQDPDGQEREATTTGVRGADVHGGPVHVTVHGRDTFPPRVVAGEGGGARCVHWNVEKEERVVYTGMYR